MSKTANSTDTAQSDQEWDRKEVTLRLNAAKVIANDRWPYLAGVIFAMVPVAKPGLDTFASDRNWRMYYDPAKVMEWDVENVAAAIIHEAGHCIRAHGDRFAESGDPHKYARLANIAGDVLINHDIREDGGTLPEGVVYLEDLRDKMGLDVSVDMTTEQIYTLLRERAETCTCPSSGGKSDDQSSGSGDDSDQDGNQDGSGSGDDNGDQDGNQDGSGSGDDNGTPDPNCPVHGQHSHGAGDDCDSRSCGQGPGIDDLTDWDCGSAADGDPRDYEIDGEKVDNGVDEERAEVLRRQTAKAIKEHIKTQGTVPAGWERFADELLNPVVDWRKELASSVRRKIATLAGVKDFTYSRPSRRAASMRARGSGIVLPAMRQPEPPAVAIVLDTSGSMSDDEIAWALTETKGVLRSMSSVRQGISVISCDASATSKNNVRNLADVEVVGGGGTDMRVGIEAAMQQKLKPEIIIVLTDGGTPWPERPVKGAQLIVGLTHEAERDRVPTWAKIVSIVHDA